MIEQLASIYHDGSHDGSFDHPPEGSVLIRIPASGGGEKCILITIQHALHSFLSAVGSS